MRLFTADELARMGWHGRSRLALRRLQLVEQLEAAHRAAYPNHQALMCSAAGCRSASRALGMCDTHYRYWRRHAA